MRLAPGPDLRDDAPREADLLRGAVTSAAVLGGRIERACEDRERLGPRCAPVALEELTGAHEALACRRHPSERDIDEPGRSRDHGFAASVTDLRELRARVAVARFGVRECALLERDVAEIPEDHALGVTVADRAERCERTLEARSRGEDVALLDVDQREDHLAPGCRAMVSGGAQSLEPCHAVAPSVGELPVVEQAAPEHHQDEALLASVSRGVEEIARPRQLDHRLRVATLLREHIREVLRDDAAESSIGARAELLLRRLEVDLRLRELPLQPDDEPLLARREHLDAEAPRLRGESTCGAEIDERSIAHAVVDAREPSHEVQLGRERTRHPSGSEQRVHTLDERRQRTARQGERRERERDPGGHRGTACADRPAQRGVEVVTIEREHVGTRRRSHRRGGVLPRRRAEVLGVEARGGLPLGAREPIGREDPNACLQRIPAPPR